MTENQENRTITECLNCHQQLPDQATFCPNCGQKSTTGLISLKEFLHNFLDNVFNLDSRIVQTMKWLFIPLYLVMSIIFFAALSFVGDIGDGSEIIKMNFDGKEMTLEEMLETEAHKVLFLKELDTLSGQIALFEEETAKVALDSLRKLMGKGLEKDSFNLTLAEENRKFDYNDMLLLDGKELIHKYKIEGFWNQLLIKQTIHFAHDQSGYVRELLQNIPLMLLAMMPFLALSMKLLYIRRQRFYVEHLVLNFHHHAFAFLLLTFLLILPRNLMEIILIPVIMTIFIFLYLTMKRYYLQGYGKTFMKFLAFNLFYLFSFFVVLFFTLIISLLLF